MRPPRNVEEDPTFSESPFQKMLDRFQNMPNAVYFHKRATKSMVTEMDVNEKPWSYQLEFPPEFVLAHEGILLGGRVTFERPGNSDRKWPLAVTVKAVPSSTVRRLVVYGTHGWNAFVEENQVKVDDHLIFSLISPSRFVVYISRKEPPVGIPVPVVHTGSRDAIQRLPNVSAPSTRNESRCQETSCHLCGQTTPELPQFVATVSLPHMRVPSRFWLRHRELLPSFVIELQGPSDVVAMKVDVLRYVVDNKDIKYQLESGWTEFAAANLLNSGDVLLFSIVGRCRFKVEVLARKT